MTSSTRQMRMATAVVSFADLNNTTSMSPRLLDKGNSIGIS